MSRIYPVTSNFTGFPSCCQAYILHNLSTTIDISTRLKKLGPRDWLELRDYVLGESDRMCFAITSQEQEAWEYVLEKLGFTKQRTYQAKTGSLLTAWVFVPEDQEVETDDDDY